MSHVSEEGKPYSKRYCKVVGKIATPDVYAHGMVAESRCVGFYIGKDALVPERIKIFVEVSSNSTVKSAETQQNYPPVVESTNGYV
jgi:hypothetical protein